MQLAIHRHHAHRRRVAGGLIDIAEIDRDRGAQSKRIGAGAAVDREVNAPDSLSDYVMGLARNIITPQGRTRAGFDDPIDVPDDAGSLEKLVAYTGRRSN